MRRAEVKLRNPCYSIFLSINAACSADFSSSDNAENWLTDGRIISDLPYCCLCTVAMYTGLIAL